MKNKINEIISNKISRKENLSTVKKHFIRKFLSQNSSQFLDSGFKSMAVYAFDYIGYTILIDGVYEIRELNLIKDFIKLEFPSAVEGLCIDAGANIGNHSVFFGKIFKRVFSFEPNPKVYKLLEVNTFENENIETFNFGLSSQAKEVNLYCDELNLGGSSQEAQESLNKVTVKMEKLDDIDFNDEKVNFIKIDVEGHEIQLLEGAKKTIQKHKPIIAFEQHAFDFVEGTSDSIEFLRKYGYKKFYVTKTYPKFLSHLPFKNFFTGIFGVIFGTRKSLVLEHDFEPNFYPLIIATQ